MTDLKIEVVGKISRVDVRPTDVFVLHIGSPISTHMAAGITRWWEEKWGPGAPKLLVVPDGAQLGVIRREDLNGP
jgi:hypothetical protein